MLQCFSGGFTRMGKTDARADYRSQSKGKGWGHVFTLGHIKMEAPRRLRRKIWINTFRVRLAT